MVNPLIQKYASSQQSSVNPLISRYGMNTGSSSPGILSQIGQGALQNITSPVKMAQGQLVPGQGNVGSIQQDSLNPFKEITSQPYQPQLPNSMATKIGSTLPGIAASFIPGVRAEEAVGSLLDKLPKFFGSRVAKKALQSAAGGAASAPLMGMDAGTGAEYGAALGPIGDAAANIGKTLAKAVGGVGKSGKITAEEAAEKMASVPKGMKLPLGQVINSPLLNRTYQGLSAIPFSGAAKPYDQLNSYLQDGISKLTENSPENVSDANQHVFDMYKQAYDSAKQNTNDAFNKLSSAADNSSNIGFDKSKLDSAVSKARSEIQPKLVNKTAEKQYKPILDMLDDFSNTDIPDFKTATNVGQALNDLYRQNVSPENGLMRRYINQLKGGLEDSIDDNSSKYPELSDLRNQANQARQYQAQFERMPNGQRSPFFKINNNPNASDTGNFIDKYIKSSLGNKDNSQLLSNLISKLDDQTKSLVAKKFISPSDDLPLAKQIKNLSNLSDQQRQMLFGENKPLSDQILNLSKMFPEGKNPGFVPKTGHTGGKLVTAALAGAYHPLAALPIVGQLGQRALRSNLLKNAYLKSLQSETKNIPPELMQGIRALTLQGDNNNGN